MLEPINLFTPTVLPLASYTEENRWDYWSKPAAALLLSFGYMYYPCMCDWLVIHLSIDSTPAAILGIKCFLFLPFCFFPPPFLSSFPTGHISGLQFSLALWPWLHLSCHFPPVQLAVRCMQLNRAINIFKNQFNSTNMGQMTRLMRGDVDFYDHMLRSTQHNIR